MLKYIGVKSLVVTGNVSGSDGLPNHMWNRVTLNGEYLYLDPTWDAGSSNPTYFLLPEKCMKVDHILNSDYVDNYIQASSTAKLEYIDNNSAYFDEHCPEIKKSFTAFRNVK